MQKNSLIYSMLIVVTCLGLWSCSDSPVAVTNHNPPRDPATFFVMADGSGDFATIQDAINFVDDGDTVALGNGTYRGPGNRDIEYLGKAIIVCSASGDPDSCVLDVEGTSTDWHRGFHFQSGEGPTSILEGVTIINGYGLGGGGGVSCDGASPRLVNLVLRHNEFSGIVTRLASPIIERCLFEANLNTGLGIWSSNPVVRECVFIRNLEGAVGSFYSSATLERCTFIENENEFSGAVHVGAEADNGGFVSIRDCVFIGNRAGRFGGAVLFASPGELVDCVIVDNIAGEAGGGVEAALPGAEVTVSRTTIVGNSAPMASGLFVRSGAQIAIDHSIISFGVGGSAVECDTSGGVVYGPIAIMISCTDVFGNEGGDWVKCIGEMKDNGGNICADPLFCSLLNHDLSLTPGSPCYQTACGLVGALSVGCLSPSVATR